MTSWSQDNSFTAALGLPFYKDATRDFPETKDFSLGKGKVFTQSYMKAQKNYNTG
jgi:hypothetical protein